MTAIVVAPAPFKGALAAAAAARALGAGVRLALPDCEIRAAPVADGGEGTMDALIAALGGRRRPVTAMDPLGRPVEAAVGELPGAAAVVELAQASGYERLRADERDPEAAGTWGTGELIRAALDLGARRIIVGLGGSATTDGGLGLARVLGVRALDADGNALDGRGADMARVARLDLSGRDPRLAQTVIQVACDVDNPFHGPRGAAHVFGPQKGASPAAVARLDAGLAQVARVVRAQTGVDLQELPGAGAAGGAAGALAALLGAELTPGAPLVLEAMGFAARLEGAGLCITGEGRIDETTSAGKAPVAVAAACAAAGVPVRRPVRRGRAGPGGGAPARASRPRWPSAAGCRTSTPPSPRPRRTSPPPPPRPSASGRGGRRTRPLRGGGLDARPGMPRRRGGTLRDVTERRSPRGILMRRLALVLIAAIALGLAPALAGAASSPSAAAAADIARAESLSAQWGRCPTARPAAGHPHAGQAHPQAAPCAPRAPARRCAPGRRSRASARSRSLSPPSPP